MGGCVSGGPLLGEFTEIGWERGFLNGFRERNRAIAIILSTEKIRMLHLFFPTKDKNVELVRF